MENFFLVQWECRIETAFIVAGFMKRYKINSGSLFAAFPIFAKPFTSQAFSQNADN